ncbi:MAG: Asp-tRNA(Asn)/Glu-tRNA(Gln) amidotransferase subunit GatC [Candidatus Anstonellales archaeon]
MQKARITKEEVMRIAELARIKINERDAEKLEKDFEEILSYFSVIADIEKQFVKNKETFKESSHMFEAKPPLREDIDKQTCDPNLIISQFSQIKNRYAKAPKSLKE